MSDDANSNWHKDVTTRRWDRDGLVEHICKHGVGHPNFYSVVRLHEYCLVEVEVHGSDEFKVIGDHPLEACSIWIHGCDGCCGDNDFPGRQMDDDALRWRLSQKAMLYTWAEIDEHALHEWCVYTLHDLNVNDKLRRAKRDNHTF